MVNIKGLDKAVLLSALYNAAKAGERPESQKEMTPEEAQNIIDVFGLSYVELNGRFIGVDMSGVTMRNLPYDSRNGAGLCGDVVRKLRADIIPKKPQTIRIGKGYSMEEVGKLRKGSDGNFVKYVKSELVKQLAEYLMNSEAVTITQSQDITTNQVKYTVQLEVLMPDKGGDEG